MILSLPYKLVINVINANVFSHIFWKVEFFLVFQSFHVIIFLEFFALLFSDRNLQLLHLEENFINLQLGHSFENIINFICFMFANHDKLFDRIVCVIDLKRLRNGYLRVVFVVWIILQNIFLDKFQRNWNRPEKAQVFLHFIWNFKFSYIFHIESCSCDNAWPIVNNTDRINKFSTGVANFIILQLTKFNSFNIRNFIQNAMQSHIFVGNINIEFDVIFFKKWFVVWNHQLFQKLFIYKLPIISDFDIL